MNENQNIIETCKNLSLHEANEAETRLKVIDRVIFEILGWSHEDVTVEVRVSEDKKTEFSDYILKTAVTSIVIEAKRIGKTFFTVPDKQTVKLVGKIVQGETGKAIKQARDYARKKGIPFACVTNGNQWIIFPASRIDNVSFKESTACVFFEIGASGPLIKPSISFL